MITLSVFNFIDFQYKNYTENYNLNDFFHKEMTTIDLKNLGDINFKINRFFNPQIRDEWIEKIARETPSGSRVIDVSAGNRPYKRLFNHCQYFSHEFEDNEKICDIFRGETVKPNHDYTGDITNLLIESETFDLVLCTEVFEHVPEPIEAMKELVRICKKGGKIAVTAPFTSGSHQQPFHFYAGFSPEFYEYLAKKFNLKINKIDSQGDFFKLMCYFTNLAMYYCIPKTEPDTLVNLRHHLEFFYLTQSEIYGDNSAAQIPLSRHFNIGWCVLFDKLS